jgi:L-aminopeptidase/D-esterase-like protein
MSGTPVIPGLRIGHATNPEARTGCTVLLGPFRAAACVAGFATGTRELDSLSPLHLVPRIDALLLTGGSVFGLAAAEGVTAWLEQRGAGFDTGAARVPIVPAAVIYDLGVGRADVRPDAAMGRAACDAAHDGMPEEGAVGAGTGATAGKVLGRDRASPGGLGCHIEMQGDYRVMGLVVVNPLGDVRDDDGIIAGARAQDGTWADATRVIRAAAIPGFGRAAPAPPSSPTPSPVPTPGTNTTLAVVVTDAPLAKDALSVLARMSSAALARRITPVFTPFDGDMIFALSTSPEPAPVAGGELLAIGAAACAALEHAIVRAVRR